MPQTLDWTHLYPTYANQWVALANDEKTVVGNARSLRSAIKKARQRGFDEPLMFKVPAVMLPYVGSC